ncbi:MULTISPECIES: NarK/NasA family nitrate transporter [Caulobacter]|jgi:NNP family nitrate/nitrite transporter-like MFS transporter|uniref:NNP family nitrate/nitrite transporter-like MFS transporter n=1 Tax=Caulobacter rhizosphaerae TaxID=2010972 RepID=A0ABU1MTA9_9CAUL|nr:MULTISPECIES: nitrate/nitrite transporter [Caulobacter]KQZ32898.1 MFS transporter [Caulobacter sp. Root1472]MDR6529422.1 NNP family nitrate/nitrite transporter-like MFS transporter [Caulobacter rhizosphaerae]
MLSRDFLKAGHAPTLFAAFLYFDLSFMVWVILGPLGVAIAKDFHLDPAQKGLMVAIPVLAGAVLRLVNGVLVDRIGPKKTGMMGQLIVLAGLVLAWFLGIHNYHQVLALGLVLGVAGASFAVALPLASRWYPQEHQGLALGIAGAGNSGTALAALFAPILAKTFGWQNVIGMAAIPLAVAFVIYMLLAKDAPEQPAPKKLAEYLDVLKVPDAWWLMLLYAVTFGGFVGLASSLTIYFNAEYSLSPVTAGFFTAACVFAGSFIRPVGGALADRFGGVRTLSVVFALAAAGLATASFQMPSAYVALAVLMFSMLALGAGNGAVFQLAPQRFRKEIGVMTGLIGMTGGVGGFYLASSLGMAKKMTGSYQVGFLGFAALAVFALVALHSLKARWRAVWPTLHGDSAAPVRV